MQNALKHVGHLLKGENGFISDLNACFKVFLKKKKKKKKRTCFKVWEEEDDQFLSI